ncbi:hypothetical protein RND81_02G012000 [Saponaria officinalis]|uniref:Inositol polyphosphate-related phosphatase domain-containing protein n=1 Tax=Saponaria officinalis TaxID=3572 RepID=A0AAW1MLW9_SAPOF
MTDGNSKNSKLSWPKTLVKKWFNIKNKAEDFHADNVFCEGFDEDLRKNFSEREACTIKKSKTERSNRRSSDRIRCNKIDVDTPQVTDAQNYRIVVATWNVAGKSPTNHLNIDDWLHTSPPAEIYVLGFQEIVPLNAGNVLGTEDDEPAKKWLALISRTLNSLPDVTGGSPSPVPDPFVELDADFEGSTRQKDPFVELDADFEGSTRQKASDFFHRRSIQSMTVNNDISEPQPWLNRRFSVCDRVMSGYGDDDYDTNYRWRSSDDDDENLCESPIVTRCSPDCQKGQSWYCLVTSKQMVGIYLTVWVRSDLRDDVRNMKVSCVGRGLMGYLGNKGSISISMSLHQTSFCFVCSHLTSGQKEGDELRRNSDVMEILRKTRFPRVQNIGDEYSPQTILEHDRVIWLGDLNYRIALSYRCAKALVEMRNWKTLLENDQLRIKQRHGRVFEGWREGKIYFPPTYKYTRNSDRYAGTDVHQKQKRRTPAWCDRILWHGKGIRQLSYVRGESRFSDHRPVYSMFLVEVESSDQGSIRKSTSCSNARVDVEELLRHGGFNFY